jgi:hypothetical protein
VIGTSTYVDNNLSNIPVVDRTVADVAAALTDPFFGVVAAGNCVQLLNEGDVRKIGGQLLSSASQAKDLFVVYYTGHGLLAGRRNELYLALPDSLLSAPVFNSLEYDNLRGAVLDSEASAKVIILDCCYSGRAITDYSALAGQAKEMLGQLQIDGTYILTSAPQHGLSLFRAGEVHTAFTGRLLRLLREGIPDGPALLTIDEIYHALRMKMRAEGLPEPQKSSTGIAHLLPIARNRSRLIVQSAARSLRERTATREQLLTFFSERGVGTANRWWYADDMSDPIREDALRLMLSRLDAATADAIVLNWDVLSVDILRIMERQLDHGDITLAAWCLGTIATALPFDVEDQILAHLLLPEQMTSQQQQRQMALVALLQRRSPPACNSLHQAHNVLIRGDHDAWQAVLTRELLASEIAGDPSLGRAIGWANWLGMSGPARSREAPGWVRALQYVRAAPTGGKAPESISMLLRDVTWATVIIPLARASATLPHVLRAAGDSLTDLASDLAQLSEDAPASPGRSRRDALLRALDAAMEQRDLPAETAAAIGEIRTLLVGRATDFPIRRTAQTVKSYSDELETAIWGDSVRPSDSLSAMESPIRSTRGGKPRTAAGRAAYSSDEPVPYSGRGRAAYSGRTRAGRGRSAVRSTNGQRRSATAGRREASGRRTSGTRVAPQRSRDPFVILISLAFHMIAAIWITAADAVGSVARWPGGGARDVEPQDRRDGLGLYCLGAAITLAACIWDRTGSVVAHTIYDVVSDALGMLAWCIPPLVALLAWRFFRHPDRNSETARAVGGWMVLIIGALGLIQIAKGIPHPSDGLAAIRDSGGFIGYLMSAPLASAVTPWVTSLLLAMLAGFGVLVMTGTPLHQIPDRLVGFKQAFGRSEPARGDTYDSHAVQVLQSGDRTSRIRISRGAIKFRSPAAETGEHLTPYDSPLLRARVQRTTPGSRIPWKTAIPEARPGKDLSEQLGFGSADDGEGGTAASAGAGDG